MARSSDLVACAALLRDGSRSFHAASRLLPARVRDPAVALYAFCRVADDAVDFSMRRAAAVATMRARLEAVYAGRPFAHPADRALAAVVHATMLPRPLLDALLEGFAWDAEQRRYADLSALLAYAARVAGSVGAMMAVLMDCPEQAARACDLGVAMQLTNIARDVGEDARAGRLYLPLDWLHQAGIDPAAFLARPAMSPALAGVIERLLQVAHSLYARADAGIAALPWDCRSAIFAARALYAGIGAEVARAGHDSVSRRAVVPRGRKLAALAGAARRLATVRRGAAGPSLAETRFLLDAIPPRARQPRRRGVGERAVWVMELFATLDDRPLDGLARSR